MRRAASVLVLWAAAAASARAEPLPPGSIGLVGALASGTFADASRLGYGYQLGAQAAWQPMRTENRLGFSMKWSFVFGTMYEANVARVSDELLTFQMDVMAGVRIRPGASAARYLTLRVGPQLMRTNQVIPAMDDTSQRAFVGAVASVGVDWYAGIPWLGGQFLYSLEARLCQIDIPGVRSSPTTLAVMFGLGKTGP
ncbi:MAG TPA: hypothetical protein VK427_00060 [Kofleriaceae bacterium]|nr:hypothetical protein [Kofleriaceae bacterium]